MTYAYGGVMARKDSPTEAELLKMVPHVAYDMKQLNAQFEHLPMGRADTAEEHAAINAFLVHARNLIGFYWPPEEKDRRKGDVFAFDFVPGLEIEQPDSDQTVHDLKGIISKRTAHICLDRIDTVAWAPVPIHQALDDAGSQFLARVEEPYRQRFVRQRVVYTDW